MIKVISSEGCSNCEKVRRFMENFNIPHEYMQINDFQKDEQKRIKELARKGGQLSFPIIIEDDRLIKFEDIRNTYEKFIIKRNNKRVTFDENRIVNAILGAMNETDHVDEDLSKSIAREILLESTRETNVESIQDAVENKLLNSDRKDVAKRYILYREEHNQKRKHPWNMDELQKAIYENKYEYEKEGLENFFDRISGDNAEIRKMIRDKKFLPAGRIMSNRGLYKLGRKVTYSNCYVLTPPDDNLESIFEVAGKLARTYSFGGGCGVDISNLAPRGAKVNNSAIYTTGAVSFMELYSLVTGLIGQNGRRGALMLSLSCDHPDLEEFINIKNDINAVTKANISIRITDNFMEHVVRNKPYTLEYTRKDTGEVIKKVVDAAKLFRMLSQSNWRMAEPGSLFWDKICNWCIISADPRFEFAGTNPCA